MNKLRLAAFTTATCFVLVGASLGACSSDDTSVDTDTGVDGGRAETGTSDAPSSDTSTTPDTFVPDTFVPDTGVTPANLADTVANKVCSALARCCFGNANPPEGGADGGTFDKQGCLDLYKDLGFENSSVGHTLFTGGKVELDQVAVFQCLQKIDALMCTLTGAALQDIRNACFAAVKGKVTVGQPCGASVECAPGLFCLPAADAGLAGSCVALRTTGQACGVFDRPTVEGHAVRAEEACSYRGGGTPAMRCDSLDPNDPNLYSDPSTWTCKPTVANGQPCNTSVWCQSGICDPATFTCTSPAEYFTRFSCEAQVDP